MAVAAAVTQYYTIIFLNRKPEYEPMFASNVTSRYNIPSEHVKNCFRSHIIYHIVKEAIFRYIGYYKWKYLTFERGECDNVEIDRG